MIPLMMDKEYKPQGWRKCQYKYQALRLVLQYRQHAVDM